MNKEVVPTPRPTFKRTLRRISMISVIITMTFIWLLLCFASVVTLKQYAQNLELTGATMSHSLEASLVFNDAVAANETLATLGKQGSLPWRKCLMHIINGLHGGRGTRRIIPTRWARWSTGGCSCSCRTAHHT